MIFKNKAFFFILFIYCSTFSQNNINTYDFIGTLILKSNALITYRIQFGINDDIIKGYSYTDLNGKNETKSEINGIYNRKNNSILLKESNILYTKSKEIEDIFCFINLNAKIKLKNNRNSIQGSFVGLYRNKDTCSTGGKVLLMSLEDAFNKMEKVSKKIQNIKKIDSLSKENFKPSKFLDDIKPNTLNKDEVLTVFWNSDTFVIEVWDNGKEDGDLISLMFNDKTILRRYEVKNEKKRIELKLEAGNNVINITANNNGGIFPNTAKATLIDGNKNHLISTNLESGQSSKINIIYNKKL